MGTKSILMWSAVFLYCMYLIGNAAILSFYSITKGGHAVEDIMVLLIVIGLSHVTLKHWVSDLMDWSKPPEEPDNPEDKQ